MDDTAILCRGLIKIYKGGVAAVRGLDLEVARGECFGLLGPNGAGKTTTVEILEGLLEPTDGEVRILGRGWRKDETWLRERLGISFQHTYLPEKLAVRELVQLFRSFFVAGRSVDEVIDLTQLREKEHARFETLSGGQKQRLAVACALVGDPEILFLDEPTTGLDPQSRRALWDVLHELKRRGGTVLLTTHAMDEAERLCDRIAIVDHGKRIALGTPPELIRSLGAEQIIEVTVGPELAEADLAGVSGVTSVRPHAGGYALAATELHVSLPALLALAAQKNATVSGLATHRATLEDVFVNLTGRQLRE
jgi:ABC-2 type transport system ATP-binding protein